MAMPATAEAATAATARIVFRLVLLPLSSSSLTANFWPEGSTAEALTGETTFLLPAEWEQLRNAAPIVREAMGWTIRNFASSGWGFCSGDGIYGGENSIPASLILRLGYRPVEECHVLWALSEALPFVFL
ncbi:hypothetical protein M569_08313 [Genlisea aurea]|uniref:Secreted protein n=1 Tax=Genlisea aurea TaxID=192259 RepID=S8CIC5_9LAMI|nr:hypothetical protein M569_08313 [Genlisea aurea]